MRLLTVLLIGLCADAVSLDAQQSASSVDYKKDIQPILNENCTVCHKGASAPAALRLDSAAGVFQGGASGKVVVPGKSSESILAQRISATDGSQMPPSGPLGKKEIATIIKWIDEGAKADVSAAELAGPATTHVKHLEPSITRVTEASQERAMLDYYCVTCHTGADAPMGLKLDELDVTHVEKSAEKWEMVVRKLRAGMMPPAGN